MTNARKPREFWITLEDMTVEPTSNIRPFVDHVHVREVLPDEPDCEFGPTCNHRWFLEEEAHKDRLMIEKYKSLCAELAEALESARGLVITYAMQTYSKVAYGEAEQIDDTLAKYRAIAEGEKKE